MPRQPKAPPRCVNADSIYTLADFLASARIGRTTYLKALADGLELPVTRLGRNKYVRGQDGIAWLLALAERRQAS